MSYGMSSGEVILLPRPRRFGKTLNLSMFHYFFEKTDASHAHLFHNTLIWQKHEYHALQGQFPVIYLTFKDIKEEAWPTALEKFSYLISEEFNRHGYLMPHLTPYEKKDFELILAAQAYSGKA